MDKKMNCKYRRPEGVKDLLPEMAERKRLVENRLLSTFLSWGYQEVATPALELESLFNKGLKAGLEKRLYRFPDIKGAGLVLRPDWTLPIARLVVTHLKNAPLPLRLAYCGSIFRMISSLRGEKREFSQTGIELIGEENPPGDAEVIALTLAALHQIGISEVKVCLGDAGFLTAAISAMGLSQEESIKIESAVGRRDFVALKQLLSQVESKDRHLLQKLPHLRGGLGAIEQARFLSANAGVLNRLECLESVIKHLRLLGAGDKLVVDLSLARELDYYTGVVFEFYSPYMGTPLGGGGRYDNLLSLFGQSLPATGSAINIDSLLILQQRQQRAEEQPSYVIVCYEDGLEQEAQKEAAGLRCKGSRVILDLHSRTFSQAWIEAQRLQVNYLNYVSEEKVISKKCC